MVTRNPLLVLSVCIGLAFIGNVLALPPVGYQTIGSVLALVSFLVGLAVCQEPYSRDNHSIWGG